MKIRVISTYEDILKLERKWRDLFKNSGTDNIFTSWEWCMLWWKHFGKTEKLMVLTVEDNGEIIGIAPLMIIKGNYLTLWKPIIRFLGEEMMADYMDFLILREHKKVIGFILDFLKKMKWGRIELKRIPDSSLSWRAIKETLLTLKYPYLFLVDCVSPYVKIEEKWEDYYKSLSKSLRQDIRITVNNLNRIGKISFRRCQGNSLDSLLDEFYEMHKKRQSFKAGKSLFEDRSKCNFFSDLALVFGGQGWADISLLQVNGTAVSFVFALKYDRIFYYWVPAINPEYRKYSIGKLHIIKLIERCFQENYREFDFMIGDEPYKLRWAKSTRKNYEIKIYRNNLLYRLDNIRIKSRGILKDMKNRYPLLERLWTRMSKYV